MAQQLGSNYYNSPYKFNGKELDEETGFYYYGARYYDPRISIWQSVDPLAEMFPAMSPYNFCYNNPLRFVDPSGMSPEGNDIIDPPKKGTGTRTGNRQGVIPAGQPNAGMPDSVDVPTEELDNVSIIVKKTKYYPSGVYGDNGFAEKFWSKMPLTGSIFKLIKGLQEDDYENAAWGAGQLGFEVFGGYLIGRGISYVCGRLLPVASEIIIDETIIINTTADTAGRLGNAATRTQIGEIATNLESRGYTISGGGGRTAEEFLKPLAGGRKGGSYLDITATHPNYPTLRINTVDVYKNGLPTLRELNNATRIRTQIAPDEHLLLIPKR